MAGPTSRGGSGGIVQHWTIWASFFRFGECSAKIGRSGRDFGRQDSANLGQFWYLLVAKVDPNSTKVDQSWSNLGRNCPSVARSGHHQRPCLHDPSFDNLLDAPVLSQKTVWHQHHPRQAAEGRRDRDPTPNGFSLGISGTPQDLLCLRTSCKRVSDVDASRPAESEVWREATTQRRMPRRAPQNRKTHHKNASMMGARRRASPDPPREAPLPQMFVSTLANVGQHWANFGHFGSNVGQSLFNFGLCLANIGQGLPKLWPNSDNSCWVGPRLARIWPKLTNSGQN